MRKMLLTTLAILAISAVASADVLWDQSTPDPSAPGFFNTESGSPPFGLTMFTVNDIVVDDVWNVTTISTYWSILDEGWSAITQGYLHVFPKTGALPAATDDPTMSMLVPMTAVVAANEGTLTADGLGLALQPGEYWIGITPIAPSGPFGPEVQFSAANFVGAECASFDPYSPGDWFNFNPGYDATILIEGDVTVATEGHSLTNVKSLFR